MMKKLLCLLLCVVMMAALFVGCAPSDNQGSEANKTGGALKAGYGREDVTPDAKDSLPLAGLAARDSMGVKDPLYITCVAIQDEEGNTFLLYHCDFLKAYSVLLMCKRQVAKATGVPADNIVIANTHNHSAPALDNTTNALMEDYQKLCKNALVNAGKAAVEDLKPATMYTTSKKCEGMTYVRHYERPNGKYHGKGGSVNDLYVGYADPVDDNMELIKFVREGGKDILMMNWQGHPRGHSDSDTAFNPEGKFNKQFILSDVDIIRKTVEAELDCHFAYYLGASGNVNNASAIPEDRITKDYIEHGKALGQLAIDASKNFTKVEGGAIKKVSTKVTATMKNGSGTEDLAISAISIGNAAVFLIAPYEMFSVSALDLKEYSKFGLTYIVTCADNAYGYMPTSEVFDRVYENNDGTTVAYEMEATSYAQGTAEALVAGYKTLMDQLYTN